MVLIILYYFLSTNPPSPHLGLLEKYTLTNHINHGGA
jgi:hypothetical protein